MLHVSYWGGAKGGSKVKRLLRIEAEPMRIFTFVGAECKRVPRTFFCNCALLHFIEKLHVRRILIKAGAARLLRMHSHI